MTAAPVPVTPGDEELAALRDAAARCLRDLDGDAAVRAMAEGAGDYDEVGWQRLAGQLGLAGLVVPEAYGGAGAGLVELGVVLEESGRSLFPSPLLATSLAGWALAGPRASHHGGQLTAIAAGHCRGTVAPGRPGEVSVHADADGLTGVAETVLDAGTADLAVVAARTTDGDALFLVDLTSPGVGRVVRSTVDRSRPVGDLHFDRACATRIGDAAAVARLRAVAAIAVACEQVGGARAALDSAVDYAGVRSQFGRVIGSFQAVKHLCADVLLAVESASAAARRAVRAADDDDADLEVLAAVAKAWCSEAYVQAAETSLHIHGGIGFTWEHAAHLHLKRAKVNEHLFGDARHHRERLADLLGI